ncbi:MAG: MaoC family dehydratase N-terminal domain-containing protein [Desulfosarcina sp.]|nr:MaoC family dehydratase N-terminal domain-containing protein [Desulfobacterales bacterium]
MPNIHNFQDVAIGDAIPLLKKEPVSREQLIRYAGASGDFNPIHTDSEAGKAAGVGGQIAHGMLIMGFVGQAATNFIPKKYLKKLNVRFAGMTRPGDVISVMGKVTEKNQIGNETTIKCELIAVNQKNETVMNGDLEAVIPIS